MKSAKKPLFSVRELCFTALGAALIAVCAWISIPVEVPFTLQTFAIFLVTGLLGLKCGFLSVLVYLLLGMAGLPVFAGFKSGLGALMGVTGGYLIGFLFTALAVGLITKFFGKKLPVLIGAMVLGLALCYAFGSVWFLLLYLRNTGPITLWAVLLKCVVPFLPADALKIALAAILTNRLSPVIHL